MQIPTDTQKYQGCLEEPKLAILAHCGGAGGIGQYQRIQWSFSMRASLSLLAGWLFEQVRSKKSNLTCLHLLVLFSHVCFVRTKLACVPPIIRKQNVWVSFNNHEGRFKWNKDQVANVGLIKSQGVVGWWWGSVVISLSQHRYVTWYWRDIFYHHR